MIWLFHLNKPRISFQKETLEAILKCVKLIDTFYPTMDLLLVIDNWSL